MKDQNIVASGGLLIAGHADLWQAWTSLTLRLLLLETGATVFESAAGRAFRLAASKRAACPPICSLTSCFPQDRPR